MGRSRRYARRRRSQTTSLATAAGPAQTWEDPHHVTPDTGCGGDNDPLDAVSTGEGETGTRTSASCERCRALCASQVEVGCRRHAVGAIVHVKVRAGGVAVVAG